MIVPDESTFDKYYNGCCNGTFWPLFHSMPDRTVFDLQTWRVRLIEKWRVFSSLSNELKGRKGKSDFTTSRFITYLRVFFFLFLATALILTNKLKTYVKICNKKNLSSIKELWIRLSKNVNYLSTPVRGKNQCMQNYLDQDLHIHRCTSYYFICRHMKLWMNYLPDLLWRRSNLSFRITSKYFITPLNPSPWIKVDHKISYDYFRFYKVKLMSFR